MSGWVRPDPSLLGILLRLASAHAVQGFLAIMLRMMLGVICESTPSQDSSLIHFAITPEEGWPILLWSQNTSCTICELGGVRADCWCSCFLDCLVELVILLSL